MTDEKDEPSDEELDRLNRAFEDGWTEGVSDSEKIVRGLLRGSHLIRLSHCMVIADKIVELYASSTIVEAGTIAHLLREEFNKLQNQRMRGKSNDKTPGDDA